MLLVIFCENLGTQSQSGVGKHNTTFNAHLTFRRRELKTTMGKLMIHLVHLWLSLFLVFSSVLSEDRKVHIYLSILFYNAWPAFPYRWRLFKKRVFAVLSGEEQGLFPIFVTVSVFFIVQCLVCSYFHLCLNLPVLQAQWDHGH